MENIVMSHVAAGDRTFVLVKPDGVGRGLVGEILGRLERAGLQISQLRVVTPEPSLVENHYPSDDGWLATVGGKTLDDYQSQKIDPVSALGTSDPVEIGRQVKTWLVEFLCSGPCVAAVIEGHRAVENVRRLVGATLPVTAAPGTIRGDYAVDSPKAANAEARPVRNLVHASGEPSEAEYEISLWFSE
jgi:nucleoside-diphosphate kinase